MEDLLLWILSIIGLFALYWALVGQWKYNKMMNEAEEKSTVKEPEKEEVKNQKNK